jgi:unsaturated rhamnogalacturonyl hydrolase
MIIRFAAGLLCISLLIIPPLLGTPSGERPLDAENAPLAVRFADWIMSRWPDPTTMTTKGWEYNNGIVLHGIAGVFEKTGDHRYLDYIRRFVDSYLGESDTVDLGKDHNIDRIQPGVLLLFLYEQTGIEKYRRAADHVRRAFDKFPRNEEGGFWHKTRYPDEMWLDGIYMGQPFLVRYGQLFGDAPYCVETAISQISLIARHVQRPDGLLLHAWDGDRNAAWADSETGLAPEVWGRGMGWFAMALVDVLKYVPPDHPGADELLGILQRLAAGLKNAQDTATGLWYQVLDKGDRPDNWHETSATGMFVYALKVGVDEGYLETGYLEVAEKGWVGLKSKIARGPDGSPVLRDAVQGMGVQSAYSGYIDKERLHNSPHGLCAVLLAASRMEQF